jgi:hypothetical protein
LIGVNILNIDFGGEMKLAVEHAVIDFHRNRLDRPALLLARLRNVAHSADGNVAIPHGQFDCRTLNSGKFDADPDAFLAAVGINGRLPRRRRTLRQTSPCNMRRDLVQRAVQPAQSDCANRFHRELKFDASRRFFNRQPRTRAAPSA